MGISKSRRGFKSVLIAMALAVALACLVACGAQPASSASLQGASDSAQASASASDAAASSEAAAVSGEASYDSDAEYGNALAGTGIVTGFIGEPFYEGEVADEADALAAAESAMERVGGDESVKLEIDSVVPNEDATTYYLFKQRAGDVLVYGASVKLIVDKDKKAVGLVSAILPNVKLPDLDTWAVSAEQAEKTVLKEAKSQGYKGVDVIEGASEQTVIPIAENGMDIRYRFAWVVYTQNYLGQLDVAYLAHYVNEDGDYLYCIPVAEPHNADSLAGDTVTFAFDKFEESTWSGKARLHDGTEKEIEVPVAVDPQDGTVYLADVKRKVVCADYAQFTYEESMDPRVIVDGEVNNDELLAYYTFIRIWDFYDSIGWTGPDDKATPSLLLMDMVDENGEPIDNAFYQGFKNGWQTFAFNRVSPDGENTDVMAHEFTHCVTTTTMTTNVFTNDLAAINEGMSDIMGNLVEMLIDDRPDSAWLIGDAVGKDKTYRSMKDPTDYAQPAYVWDWYYAPNAATPNGHNDYGGAHENSSLLNIVSYRLDQAGMQPNDQFYFWMNVALTMTPYTDFTQMIDLLPWCMEHAGYSQYVDTVKQIIAEVGYANRDLPETLPDKYSLITFDYPDEELVSDGLLCVFATPMSDAKMGRSWPIAGTNTVAMVVPEDDYFIAVAIYEAAGGDAPIAVRVYTPDGWVASESAIDKDLNGQYAIHVDAGQVFKLATDGLEMKDAA